MFFKYIKNEFIRKNIGLYLFSFAILLGQDSSNYSLSFDGEDDYVSIPGSEYFDNLGDFSFSIWIRLEEDFSLNSSNYSLSLIKIITQHMAMLLFHCEFKMVAMVFQMELYL